MTDYLEHQFDIGDADLISVIDELPLWSAPFGMQLLDRMILKKAMNVLDIGCGLGFPLVEIAQRLGPSSTVYGIDPWERALDRIRLKLKTYCISNVLLSTGFAESLPFSDDSFHLLVSNNGINNVQNVETSLAECFRVSRSGAQFVLTMNLPESMIEFYSLFRSTLQLRGMQNEADAVVDHIHSKRPPLHRIEAQLTAAGFVINSIQADSFKLRFMDASTMFQHSLIKFWFLPPWKELVAPDQQRSVFAEVECALNEQADQRGELVLTIPFVTIDACAR